ncbi:MAG: lamin tail domain-containing protein, partial [Myxococcales bacterium]|nr:lamin tail domain-containing protein [Myxococcales bacterium]
MRRLLLAPILLAAASCGPDSASDGCKDKLLPGDLVITEVFADAKAPPGGSGTDEGKEWFEIYNASDRPLELKGLTVTHSRPDDSKAKSHVMEDVTIAPGQFLTLGNTTQDLVAPFIDYGYSADLGDFFNTDGGKVTLLCKSTEIDHATYESVKEGHSRQLTNAQPPDYTLNDDPNQWCQADDSEFEAGNFGTPGSDSDCSPVVVGQCSDAGVMRDTVAPMPGDLVITEVMPNPGAVSDTLGEWIEVLATTDVDLNGLGLDRAGDSSNPNVITNPQCLRLRAGQYALFAKNADMTMNG